MTVPDTPTTALIGDAISMAMTIAAAKQDATPAQLLRMRELVPELKMYKLSRDDTRIRAKLRDIMGNDWRPSGELGHGVANPLDVIAAEATKRGIDPKDLFG